MQDKKKRQNIIDISPLISEKTAVFPGDQRFSRTVAMDFTKGDHLLLSSVQSTVHIGAHTDAPNHYHADGCSIEQRDLDFYLGPCQVIDVTGCKENERLYSKDIADVQIHSPRVLFRTDSFPDPNTWNDSFLALSPELIEHLHKKGVRLVGIDTPSIDPAKSQKLESHAAVYDCDMAILEGIVLSHVKPGKYFLVALPLAIAGADAAPVRAVLLEDSALVD